MKPSAMLWAATQTSSHADHGWKIRMMLMTYLEQAPGALNKERPWASTVLHYNETSAAMWRMLYLEASRRSSAKRVRSTCELPTGTGMMWWSLRSWGEGASALAHRWSTCRRRLRFVKCQGV